MNIKSILYAERVSDSAKDVITEFAAKIRHSEKLGVSPHKLKMQLKEKLEALNYAWEQDPNSLELISDTKIKR